MKRIIIALAALALAGCGNGEHGTPTTATTVDVEWIKLGHSIYRIEVDGMDCIVLSGNGSGGISCDWGQK